MAGESDMTDSQPDQMLAASTDTPQTHQRGLTGYNAGAS
jgi:hypothetical protein